MQWCQAILSGLNTSAGSTAQAPNGLKRIPDRSSQYLALFLLVRLPLFRVQYNATGLATSMIYHSSVYHYAVLMLKAAEAVANATNNF